MLFPFAELAAAKAWLAESGSSQTPAWDEKRPIRYSSKAIFCPERLSPTRTVAGPVPKTRRLGRG
jgi:hypothetical protein